MFGEKSRLAVVLAGLLTGAASLQAMAPVSPLIVPQLNSWDSGPAPLVLPAVLHPGDGPTVPQTNPQANPRAALMRVAEKYSKETHIPYVWGGSAVGSKASCDQCRACLTSRINLSVEKRRLSCQACKQCGMDCSHFVNRMFKEAGLAFPYLPTSRLKRLTAGGLRTVNLMDIGNDLRLAKPGDLLLHRRHVVMLLALKGPRTGDFIHVSRLVKRGRIGGVEVVRDADLERYRGKVLRILRHTAIDQSDKGYPTDAPPFRKIDLRGYDLSTQRIVRAQ